LSGIFLIIFPVRGILPAWQFPLPDSDHLIFRQNFPIKASSFLNIVQKVYMTHLWHNKHKHILNKLWLQKFPGHYAIILINILLLMGRRHKRKDSLYNKRASNTPSPYLLRQIFKGRLFKITTPKENSLGVYFTKTKNYF